VSSFVIYSASNASADAGYRGAEIAVGTRHCKERQLAEAFDQVLGARLVVPPDLDTDRFGTFTPEVVRTGTALAAARAKAHDGMDTAERDHGLASEASYGPLSAGVLWHEEILLFVDRRRGMEVLEGHRTPAVPALRHLVRHPGDLPRSVSALLPNQALTVRPAGHSDRSAIVKGLTDVDALTRAIAAAGRHADDGYAVVEPDLRAHHNPTRQQVLSHLAWRLAHRLATRCPNCSAPGYGRVDTVAGLPCGVCASPTPLPLSHIRACAVCEHRSIAPAGRRREADPGHCPVCNP
jgi:hypothetical protein